MHRMDKGELFEETMFRSDRNHWVRKSREEESNMIPWEEDIIIYNFVSQIITILIFFTITIFICITIIVHIIIIRDGGIRNGYIAGFPWKTTLFVCCIQPQLSRILIIKITLLITKMMMMMQTRILKNQEACANTLSMECMDFYHR